jgi:hypothetical protein
MEMATAYIDPGDLDILHTSVSAWQPAHEVLGYRILGCPTLGRERVQIAALSGTRLGNKVEGIETFRC